MTEADLKACQEFVCQMHGVEWCQAPLDYKAGVARNVTTGLMPVNGLRHLPQSGTTGWYIWAGTELSDAPDFFVPMRVCHLIEECPLVLKFLGLPPGWRFLADGANVDVWYDEELLRL